MRREGEKDSDWLDQGPLKCCTLKMGAQSLGSLWWPRTRHCNQLKTLGEKVEEKDRESREWLDVKALRMWTRVLRVDAGGAIP